MELAANDGPEWTKFVDTWGRVGEEAIRLNASVHHRHLERLRSGREGVDEIPIERQLWCLLMASFALCIAIAIYVTGIRVSLRAKFRI